MVFIIGFDGAIGILAIAVIYFAMRIVAGIQKRKDLEEVLFAVCRAYAFTATFILITLVYSIVLVLPYFISAIIWIESILCVILAWLITVYYFLVAWESMGTKSFILDAVCFAITLALNIAAYKIFFV